MTDQPESYCCVSMENDLTGTCEQHTREECPDFFFTYVARFDEYGLLHPDQASIITISYCPFCGSRFPESKRDRYFDELERLGISDSIIRDELPEKYKSAEWWKSKGRNQIR